MYECVACQEWLAQPAAATIHDSQICQSCFDDGIRPAIERYLVNQQDLPIWAGETIDFETVQHQFSADFQKEYWEAMKVYSVLPRLRVYCANACGRFLGQRIQNNSRLFRCEECETYTCTRCDTLVPELGTFHVCKSPDINIQAQFEGQTRGIDYQLCPTCDIAFFRDSGCNHMACTFCGTDFCYICGIPAPQGEGHWDKGRLCPQFGVPKSLPPDKSEEHKIKTHYLVEKALHSMQTVTARVHAGLPPGDQAALEYANQHDPEICNARADYQEMKELISFAFHRRREAMECDLLVYQATRKLTDDIFMALQQGLVRDALRNGAQPTRDLLLQHPDVAQAERAISCAVDVFCRLWLNINFNLDP
ncbi:hypothetical protein BST61_g1775 [Cercospora zeina]